ncbi:sensor histidine kinase [Piscirickettsia litoralis]|uniref:histidine kinase n=1 Tax=Piscirickettsia litoralis TaxID=1891921 RepID=A0ABX3A4I0_9GAMM|nr:ATP-binding protein [Piscirickettsia litoralis]ODN43353.1 two-component sensor histidine kinase [Piscirickettsia litoralis]
MRINTRVLLVLSLLLILIAIFGFSSYLGMRQVHTDWQEYLNTTRGKITLLNKLEDSFGFHGMIGAYHDFIKSHNKAGLDEFDQTSMQALNLIRKYRKLSQLTRAEQSDLFTLEALVRDYQKFVRDIRSRPDETKFFSRDEDERKLYFNTKTSLYKIINDQSHMQSQQIEKKMAEVTKIVAIVGPLIIFVLVGLSLMLFFYVVKPLRSLTLTIRSIANYGYLEYPDLIHSHDEMADIALSLHLMVKTLEDITEAAELIGAGQYNQQITPRSDDDALVHSINKMSRLLYEKQIDLQQSYNELEHFDSAASGELKEPMRMMLLHVESLQKEENLSKQGLESLRLINDIAKRMYISITDILEYSRANANFIEEEVEIGRCIDEALHAKRKMISAQNAKITVDFKDAKAVGTKSLLIMLYQHLIENALKYHAGNPHITFTLDTTGKYPVYGVRDNGLGIDPQYADQIFTAFTRLHSHNEFEGSGVGLATCRRIVLAHRGDIWVESEGLGQGCHFKFTLNEE